MSEITMYGAPWCPDCRRSKQFLSEQRIPFEWIDLDHDPDSAALVRQHNAGKQRIPTLVFADGSILSVPTNEELAKKLGLRVKASRSFFDLLILGGGPAGLAAAIYAAREGIDCLVIDRGALGGQAGATQRIDNYPGFPEGIGGAELARRFVEQAKRYGVEMISGVGIAGIERDGEAVSITTTIGDEYCGHAAIIATGTSYRRLDVPGEERLIGAGIHYCATCDGPFYKGADELIVIGGGNSGLEEGLFLAQFARKIRVLEFQPKLSGSRLLQDKVLNHPQFEVHTNVQVTGIEGNGRLSAVHARDRTTGEVHTYRADGAFVFIGLDPNTSFLKGAASLDRWGFVETEANFQTSLPGVFAAGDVRAGATKQLGSAVGEGITALLMVRRYLEQRAHLAPRVVNN